MLAELAAANAAFSIIKRAVQNTGDIAKAGRAISDFVIAKEELQRKGIKKKKSGIRSADLEEFKALEQINQNEQQLKELMINAGRPGLCRDYQKFCEEARSGRAAAKKAAQRRAAELRERIGLGVVGVALAAAVAVLVYFVLFLKDYRG